MADLGRRELDRRSVGEDAGLEPAVHCGEHGHIVTCRHLREDVDVVARSPRDDLGGTRARDAESDLGAYPSRIRLAREFILENLLERRVVELELKVVGRIRRARPVGRRRDRGYVPPFFLLRFALGDCLCARHGCRC